jgi:hypothetical protein
MLERIMKQSAWQQDIDDSQKCKTILGNTNNNTRRLLFVESVGGNQKKFAKKENSSTGGAEVECRYFHINDDGFQPTIRFFNIVKLHNHPKVMSFSFFRTPFLFFHSFPTLQIVTFFIFILNISNHNPSRFCHGPHVIMKK